tara:strand:- start:31 stop:228 length:198 start_codon:yes stop_codon:yes gene_type:complete
MEHQQQEVAEVVVVLGIQVQLLEDQVVVEEVLKQLLTQQQTQEQLILVVEVELVIGAVVEMVVAD